MTAGQVRWPNAPAYLTAVQTPARSFTDPVLREATFELDILGLPAAAEGQTAVVFFANTAEGPLALRCLTRPLPNAQRRYTELAAFGRSCPLPAFARCEWQNEGIEVDGRSWPLLKMERVPGPSLVQYVQANVADSPLLHALADRWREFIRAMSQLQMAHGDLQQDNVRIVDANEPARSRPIVPDFRLIDLDAAWIPSTAAFPPGESGHRHFQHPQRLRTGHWSRHVDSFSALVIYVSLRTLASDSSLWSFHNGENLIFTEDDYVHPGRSPIWARAGASRDLEVRDLVRLLDRFCRRTVDIDANLDDIIHRKALSRAAVWLPDNAGSPEDERWWNEEEQAQELLEPGAGWWPDASTAAEFPPELVPPEQPPGQAAPPAAPAPEPSVPIAERMHLLARSVVMSGVIVGALLIMVVLAILNNRA